MIWMGAPTKVSMILNDVAQMSRISSSRSPNKTSKLNLANYNVRRERYEARAIIEQRIQRASSGSGNGQQQIVGGYSASPTQYNGQNNPQYSVYPGGASPNLNSPGSQANQNDTWAGRSSHIPPSNQQAYNTNYASVQNLNYPSNFAGDLTVNNPSHRGPSAGPYVPCVQWPQPNQNFNYPGPPIPENSQQQYVQWPPNQNFNYLRPPIPENSHQQQLSREQWSPNQDFNFHGPPIPEHSQRQQMPRGQWSPNQGLNYPGPPIPENSQQQQIPRGQWSPNQGLNYPGPPIPENSQQQQMPRGQRPPYQNFNYPGPPASSSAMPPHQLANNFGGEGVEGGPSRREWTYLSQLEVLSKSLRSQSAPWIHLL
ncbi:hypothetical protein B0H10DRAFT_1298801 [Mycena sp. CBHHK59/15]|nr:hypothetical protein B0H10DRAFT_1298801 [Mycena sp. CBHHK59/15]